MGERESSTGPLLLLHSVEYDASVSSGSLTPSLYNLISNCNRDDDDHRSSTTGTFDQCTESRLRIDGALVRMARRDQRGLAAWEITSASASVIDPHSEFVSIYRKERFAIEVGTGSHREPEHDS